MFHNAAEEVFNKRLPYLIVMFLLCTRVVVETDVNGIVCGYQFNRFLIYMGIVWYNALCGINNILNGHLLEIESPCSCASMGGGGLCVHGMVSAI